MNATATLQSIKVHRLDGELVLALSAETWSAWLDCLAGARTQEWC